MASSQSGEIVARMNPLRFFAEKKERISGRTAAEKRIAFEGLLEPCWDALWRYAYRTTGNHDDAGDLLSESVLEGFRSFGQFRGETTFLRWMYRVMTTTRIDMQRKANRHPTESLELIESSHSLERMPRAAPASEPEQRLMDKMLSEPIQRALTSVPEEFRVVIVLADMEEFDYAEVGAILQIPIGTVRSRLHRGRSMIRKMLDGEPPT